LARASISRVVWLISRVKSAISASVLSRRLRGLSGSSSDSRKRRPPGAEHVAEGPLDALLGEDRAGAVLERRAHPRQRDAVAQQVAQIAQRARRDVGLGQQIGTQQVREGPGVDGVGLHPRGGDRLGPERMREMQLVAGVLEQIGEPLLRIVDDPAREQLPPVLVQRRDMRALAVQVDTDPATIRHQGLLRPGLQIAPDGIAPRAPERREARSFMASTSGSFGGVSLQLLGCGLLTSLSALVWRIVSVGAAPASQFHRGPSGGQLRVGACRGRIGARAGAGRLEGLLALQHVPDGDQQLAGDRRLGRVGLAAAALDVEVEPVPGIRRPPGVGLSDVLCEVGVSDTAWCRGP
jgi:hypothetical protein